MLLVNPCTYICVFLFTFYDALCINSDAVSNLQTHACIRAYIHADEYSQNELDVLMVLLTSRPHQNG